MLYQASFMGSADEVRELLKDGAHVNEQNEVRVSLDTLLNISVYVPAHSLSHTMELTSLLQIP